MDPPERFPSGMLMIEIGEHLKYYHKDLHTGLSSDKVTYEEALSSTLQCVRAMPDRVSLPTTNPAKRQVLRAMALENKRAMDDSDLAKPKIRTIRGTGKLMSEDCPEPCSPARRAILKKKLIDENGRPPQAPYLVLNAWQTKGSLAAISGDVTITAVDYDADAGMPNCKLRNAEILWDTGAPITIVTKDLLSKEFAEHLDDPVHEPYKDSSGTRTQVTFNLDFSNTLFKVDTITVVMDKSSIPNMRSGIILGQRDCIDILQYRSIPRSIMEAKGQTIPDTQWGDVILEAYVDLLDNKFKEIDN
ncbi:hypothetical protein F4861DRAFT_490544 [Xylaria intraflava]|nr:hypothetical protein F4861DRAFT_490544 [Xylaria intraflava]